MVNERDELGSDLVPDYLTSVKDGGFYGWPYSYFGKHVDTRVQPPRPDMVEKAIVPDYALGNHVAPLGLTFASGDLLPGATATADLSACMVPGIARRSAATKSSSCPSGTESPTGKPIDVLTGFVNKDGDAYGRPVGVEIDKKGALLVADDVGNVVWRVAPPTRTTSRSKKLARKQSPAAMSPQCSMSPAGGDGPGRTRAARHFSSVHDRFPIVFEMAASPKTTRLTNANASRVRG